MATSTAKRDPVCGFWQGPLSDFERLSIASFLANGHPFTLYSYDFIEGLPTGTLLRDAHATIPRWELFKLYGSYSSFSDHFRYAVMQDEHGWWSDLDVILLKPLDFEEQFCFLQADDPAAQETNSLFKVPQGTTFMRRCSKRASNLPRARDKDAEAEILWHGDSQIRGFCDAGWRIFHEELCWLGLEDFIHPNTLHVGQPEEFVRLGREIPPSAYATHLSLFNWTRCLGNRGGKEAPWEPGSPLAELRKRYL